MIVTVLCPIFATVLILAGEWVSFSARVLAGLVSLRSRRLRSAPFAHKGGRSAGVASFACALCAAPLAAPPFRVRLGAGALGVPYPPRRSPPPPRGWVRGSRSRAAKRLSLRCGCVGAFGARLLARLFVSLALLRSVGEFRPLRRAGKGASPLCTPDTRR